MAATGLISIANQQQPPLPQPPAVPGVPAPSAAQVPATTAATPPNVASVAAPAPAVAREIGQQETVSGQMNALLGADSEYMQSARNRAMEQANGRGLINSSLAVGNAQRAAIDSAMPIAQQDANTYAAAGQTAQQANHQLAQTGYQSLLQAAQGSEDFGYRTQENAQNIQGNMDLQTARLESQAGLQTQAEAAALTQQTQQQKATLELQTTLKQMDVDLDLTRLEAGTRDAFSAATAPIIQQVEAEISQIQRTSDDILSPEQKNAAIQELRQSMVADIQTLSTLYGYDLEWPRMVSEPRTGTAPSTGTGGQNTSPTPSPGTSGGYTPNPRDVVNTEVG